MAGTLGGLIQDLSLLRHAVFPTAEDKLLKQARQQEIQNQLDQAQFVSDWNRAYPQARGAALETPMIHNQNVQANTLAQTAGAGHQNALTTEVPLEGASQRALRTLQGQNAQADTRYRDKLTEFVAPRENAERDYRVQLTANAKQEQGNVEARRSIEEQQIAVQMLPYTPRNIMVEDGFDPKGKPIMKQILNPEYVALYNKAFGKAGGSGVQETQQSPGQSQASVAKDQALGAQRKLHTKPDNSGESALAGNIIADLNPFKRGQAPQAQAGQEQPGILGRIKSFVANPPQVQLNPEAISRAFTQTAEFPEGQYGSVPQAQPQPPAKQQSVGEGWPIESYAPPTQATPQDRSGAQPVKNFDALMNAFASRAGTSSAPDYTPMQMTPPPQMQNYVSPQVQQGDPYNIQAMIQALIQQLSTQ